MIITAHAQLSSSLAVRLIRHMSEGFAAHDADGALLDWNPAAVAITGWTRDMAAGRFPAGLSDGLHDLGDGLWINARRLDLELDGLNLAGTLFSDARAEVALRESESRFRAAFESAAVGMALLDLDGQFTQVNQALCEMVGYATEELLGRGYREITHPDDIELDEQRAAALLRGEAISPDREKRYIHQDGRVVWVTVSASVVRDARGAPLCLIAQTKNVTKRRLAEDALRASEARFRAAVEGSLDSFIILRAVRDAAGAIGDYEIVDLNAGAGALIGGRRAELVGQRLFERFPRAALSDLPGKYARVIATRQPIEDEFENPTPGMAARWFQHQIVPLDDGVAVTTRDITPRKLAEAAMRDSEERFRALSAAAPVGIYLTDVQGYCLYVNARWQEIAGLSLGESLGAGWGAAIHPDDHAAVFEAWNAAVRAEREFSREFRFSTPAGETRWVRSRAAAIRSGAAEITGYVGTIEDITEQRLADESLRASAAQLEAKTREQEAFIYTVSHDLRAPLVSIHGLAGLLAEDYAARLDDDGRGFIHRIVVNVTRMNTLLDELLTLSRIGRAEGDDEREEVDLLHVWSAVIEQLEHQLRARHADVAVEGPLPRVLANPVRLAQVFQNLLDNAVNYTPAGRAPVVRVRAEERPDCWELVVSDRGVGVPPAFRRKLFDIFQRLPDGKSLHPDGTGVGLAVVKRVIETHGGEIWVESPPGEGAAFHFTLPKAPAV